MRNDLYKQNIGTLVNVTNDAEPDLFQIVIHNDDFTPMEFVVAVLEKYLLMSRIAATEMMLEAHQYGRAAYGVFTKDVAESKLQHISDSAIESEFPLVCSMEAA